MKALKNFGGILLAAIGVLFLLSGVGLFFDPTADFAWWEVIIILILLGLLPLFGGVALLRRKATDVRPKNCPQCGNAERAPAGVLTRSSNFWINHFGGWLFASLWGPAVSGRCGVFNATRCISSRREALASLAFCYGYSFC